jgi:hypothetical protein
MATPESLGWGSFVTSEATARAACTTISHGGRSFVLNRQVAHLFLGFLRDLTATGYRYDTGPLDDWSFAYRKIRGSATATSMHAGFAVDIDALKNPLHSTSNSFPPGIDQMARRWGLQWGGRWSRPDPMHFEVALTPSQVRAFVPPSLVEEEDMTTDEMLVALRSPEGLQTIRKAVWTGTGEETPSVAGTVNAAQVMEVAANDARAAKSGVARLEEDVAKLTTTVATLVQVVEGLALGKVSGDLAVTGTLHVEDTPG